ncbi:lim and transglutaminase domain protein ltd-1 [Patella vulgata]|uniref:lim and transglutaminase domain protein ltd-1 n=1 Tax=Patella vulgata TaxID=6465 RepID=UPI0024A87824|nr:lim and transglutaminase domain protein ltd-1 [Patella vulgata]
MSIFHPFQIPQQYSYSYEILLDSLLTGLSTDLEKVRSIFIWLGSQRIKYLDDVMSDIKTPFGYMLYMKNGNGTFAEFFAQLCRFINIPCVIVRGIAKGARYEVGDDDLYDSRSIWNCVFIDGEWRIIHCHWAFTGLVGYNHGRWTTLEAESRGMIDHQKPSGGYQVFGIDEFYFLTDPDEFCYFCLPNEEMKRWQLMENPWTYQKFVSVPFLHESFFLYEMNLMSREKGVIQAPDGQVPSQGQAIDVYSRGVQQGLISEILNYRRPIRIIHDIMKATFILLGEEEEKLEVNLLIY